MRFGATQATPTASPLVIVEVGDHYFTSDGGGGNERIVSVKEDEQIWGGNTTILLDNSDGTLTNLDLRYKELKLIFSFVGQTSYEVGRLFVFSQSLISQEGKLLMTLNCIDGWGLLSLAKTSFANWYFNQEWQKEANIDQYLLPSGDTIPTELRAELIANSNRVLYHIINIIIMQTISRVVLYPGGVGLDYDPALYDRKPPISFANAISGVRQALEMTSSYIRWEGVGVFKQIRPNNHPVCYSYDKTNSSFRNVHEVGAVIPNQISFWAFNAAGDDWIEGIANDEQSQLELGQIIPRHFILAPELQVDARSTTEELTEIAEGMLDKIKQEREMGLIIAPMHCSQQLFDKIEVKDSRYSPDKTITGIVHRIVREYDRGQYQITLQVGGEGKSSTQEFGGNEAVPLYEAEPPRAPIKVPEAGDTFHLHITAAYSIPFPEVDMNLAISDPGSALDKSYGLAIPLPVVDLDTFHALPYDPDSIIVHDEDLLLGHDYTVVGTTTPVVMASYLVGGTANSDGMRDTQWEAQTFLASSTDDITAIQVILYRTAAIGDVTVSIRATDVDGKPTGSDLASGTYTGSAVTTATYGLPVNIAFTTPFTPSSGTTYAICLRQSSTSANLRWKNNTAGGYADGSRHRSTNSGSSWTSYAAHDLMFQVFTTGTMSVPAFPPPPASPDTGDALYIGYSSPFDYLVYWVGQEGVGTYTVVNQYWNGANWVTMPLGAGGADTLGGWKRSGKFDQTLAAPVDWVQVAVHGYTKYWIKHQLSSLTSMTKMPYFDRIWVGKY